MGVRIGADRAARRKTPRDVLLYLRCVNGLRQDDSARIAVRGESQPLLQMLRHDLPQVLAADQRLGDVINPRLV
jgi:hypothetical protein